MNIANKIQLFFGQLLNNVVAKISVIIFSDISELWWNWTHKEHPWEKLTYWAKNVSFLGYFQFKNMFHTGDIYQMSTVHVRLHETFKCSTHL